MSMKHHHQQQQHHHLAPSTSSRMASPLSRRCLFGRRSPDRRKKTCKNTKEEKDRTLRALEAIRLLSFDTVECPNPITPRTVTTLSSDDTTADDESNERTFFKKPSTTTSYEKSKLLLQRPFPMTDRNSSGGTKRTLQRSESNTSYLSSDTSSEIGEWPSSMDDEEDYPRYICISANNSASSRHGNSNFSGRLSITAVEEWNRRCEEEGGVFRREKYTSDMLSNLKLDPSVMLDHQQHHHGADQCIDRRKSYSSLSPIESEDCFDDFSLDETEDDDDDDISLTYSHDE